MSQHTKHKTTTRHYTGEQLAYYRKVAGMTQHDVARVTGISFNRLAYAETDRLELSKRETDVLTYLYKKHIDHAIAAIEFLRGGGQ